jgi:hypothetical protein
VSAELVRHEGTAASLPEKMQYAQALAVSGMLPAQYRQQPANLLWAMEYADSLGLHPMTAITGVHVIEGKPSASSALISALVRRAGHKLRVTGNDQRAVAQIVRVDDPEFTFEAVWTMERAQQAGLTGKKVWKQYPAAMLKARAITEVARDACEEALSGMHYTPEELGANVDVDGNPVDAEVQTLRRVQPGDGDPWAAGAQQPQTAAQGRDYLHEARDAVDADAVRRIWQEAKADGAVPEYLKQIADVGKEKAAAEKAPAETANAVVVAEIVTDGAPAVIDAETEASVAKADLRATAAQAELDNLDEEFLRSYGIPIDQAPAHQLREMQRLLTGSAA